MAAAVCSDPDPEAGTSDWMETIRFREGAMCFSDGPGEAPYTELPSGLAVVSLGCYCGVKLSFRKLGLNSATLPLDWNRTRIEKVAELLRNDFRGFFDGLRGPVPVPGTALSAFRGDGHSFWHDDVRLPEVRAKLQRRIDRLLELGASSSQLLFVRSLATTDELAHADELHAELLRKFGGAGAKVFLLVIACNQRVEEPIMSAASPGLMIFFLSPDAHNGGSDIGEPAPFCKPILWALEHLQRGGDSGGVRQVASAAALIEAGEVWPDSVGLDGMAGVASFEASEADVGSFPPGSKVEALYRGEWYQATVLATPDASNMWKVQCDVDPPGVSTTSHKVRAVGAAGAVAEAAA